MDRNPGTPEMKDTHNLPWEKVDLTPGLSTIPDFFIGIDKQKEKLQQLHHFSKPVYLPESRPTAGNKVTAKLTHPKKCNARDDAFKGFSPITLHSPSQLPRTPKTPKTAGSQRCREGEMWGVFKEEEEDDEDASTSESEYGIEDMVPSSTKAVLTNLETTLEDRRKAEIKEKLERILDRIEIASEMLNVIEQGKQFSIQEEKEELNRKQRLLTHMGVYSQSLKDRQGIAQHISDWLESCEDVEKGCITEDEWETREQQLKEIHDEIQSAFSCVDEATDKIRTLGYQLLKEAGYIDDDDDEGSRKRKKLRPFDMKDVMDESALEKPQNLNKAMVEIKLIMDQAIRFVRIQQHKNVMRAGIKQFKNLSKNVTKRVLDMKNFEEAVARYKEKMSELEVSVEKWESQANESSRKLEEREKEVQAQEQHVRELTAENSKLKSIVAELELYKDQVISSGQDQTTASPTTTSTSSTVSTLRSAGSLSKKSSTQSGSSVHSHGTGSALSVKQEIQMTSSMLNQVTKPLQAEISKLKAEVEERGSKIETLEKTLGFAQQEINHLNVKISLMQEMTGDTDSLAKVLKDESSFTLKALRDEKDSLEKQVAMMLAELNCKNELITFQEKRLKEVKEGVGAIDFTELATISNIKIKDGSPVSEEVKTMMFHIKKDLEAELERLRKHMDKEKSRQEAAIRKLEKKHKDDMNNTYKQSLHLLRAINRFKDSIAGILERENLPIAAADVKRIPKLPTDETNQSDAKLLLAQMAGSAVELLVNMEFKLSQALMNKRLEVKDNSIAKNLVAKDLETQMEAAQKAKKAAETMAETMKELKQKLVTAEEAIMEMRKMEDKRFSRLSERYRKLMYQYTNLQREFTKVTTESKKAMKEKDWALNRMVSHRNSMVQLVGEQQGMMSNMARHISKKRELHNFDIQLSVKDQKQNLDTLEKALIENKISKEMYTMTADLIKQSMELPLLKLRNLCEKYIAYRRLQEVKQVLLDQLDDSLLEEKKAVMEKYIRRKEVKLAEENKAWNEERQAMDEKRKVTFQDMASLFSEMMVEQGVLLLVPEDKLLRVPSLAECPSGETLKSGATLSSSDGKPKKRRKLRQAGSFRRSPLEEMPSELVGTSVMSMKKSGAGGSGAEVPPLLWNVNAPRVLPPIRRNEINTPRMMEFDIQQQLRAAQRALAGLRYRSTLPMANATGYDYSMDKVTPLCNLSNKGYCGGGLSGDSEEGGYDGASTVHSDAQDSGIDCIDNTMVNIRVDIKVKDQHYMAGTNMKKKYR